MNVFTFIFVQVQSDIDQFKSEGIEVESQRKAILRNLEDDLHNASVATEEYDEIHKGMNKIIEQLKNGKISRSL